MKVACVLITLFTYLVTNTNSADMCFSDGDCKEEGTCCVRVVIGGSCHQMSKPGQRCSLEPMDGTRSHPFGCPCASGATCTHVMEESSFIHGYKINHTKCVQNE